MPSTNDFLSKPLISLKQGKNCGIVTNLLFDDDLKKVTHVLVFDQISCTYHLLCTDKIKKTQHDAVVIDDCVDVIPYDGKVLNPINFDVFDTNGRHLGLVNEILLNKNYTVKSLECRGQQFAPNQIYSHSDDTLVIKPFAQKSEKPSAPQKQPEPKAAATQADALPAKTSANVGMFIIGRKCDKNILNRFNEVIIKKDSIITPEVVKKAKLSGKLLELSMHAVKQ